MYIQTLGETIRQGWMEHKGRIHWINHTYTNFGVEQSIAFRVNSGISRVTLVPESSALGIVISCLCFFLYFDQPRTTSSLMPGGRLPDAVFFSRCRRFHVPACRLDRPRAPDEGEGRSRALDTNNWHNRRR